MLSKRERERYARQLAIEGFGDEAQERLGAARVFIAGAGGLGCSAAIYLAAAGIGGLRIADQGAVELSNLNRQVAYGERDLGRGKAETIARRLHELNSGVRVEPVHVAIAEDNLPALLEGCSLVIDALDNVPSRLALNLAALRLGLPIVHGAVSGFMGQMTAVIPGETACLKCLYGNSAGIGPTPTPVIGVAAGVIGILQATEAIRIICGVGKQRKGSLLLFDGLQMDFTEVQINRDPRCPHCSSSLT
jgi:molybdopterin-synthase adenylyltransferase